jgi:hypothetical protein
MALHFFHAFDELIEVLFIHVRVFMPPQASNAQPPY